MEITSIVFYFALIKVIYSQNGKIKTSYEHLPVSSDPKLPYEIACALNFRKPLDPDFDSPVPAKERQNVGDNPRQPSTPSESVQGCECVPYFLCNKNRSATQDVDIRAAFLSGIGLVSAPPYTPCPCEQASSSPRVGAGVCKKYMDVCCGGALEVLADELPSPSHSENPSDCGRVAEVEDLQGKFPWMVAVFGDRIVNGRVERFAYLCGGSLIRQSVVLTAAHCVKGQTGLLVRAGVWDLPTSKEPLPTQDRLVQHVTVHEEYYAGALYNDVALLFLESPVDSAANVATVCLPQQGESMEGRDCVASGWGKEDFGDGKYQMSLRRVELPILPGDKCQEAFRRTILGQYFRLHESFICAGGQPGKDTCKGDGGSALVCLSDSAYVQAGIVSWGMGCGGSTPGAYVNVPLFRTWIDNQLTTFTVDNSQYRNLGRR